MLHSLLSPKSNDLKIDFENRAKKSLKKIQQSDRNKIELAINDLLYCESFNEIKTEKLKGYSDRYKIRVGNYRIILKRISNNHLQITAVSDRKEVYKKLFGIVFSI